MKRVYPGREKEFIMAYYKEFQRLIPVHRLNLRDGYEIR